MLGGGFGVALLCFLPLDMLLYAMNVLDYFGRPTPGMHAWRQC
jgi:hypothetical protein